MHDLMTNELVSQVTASAVVVAFINYLKKAAWIPFINANSLWVNRLVALLAAIATSIGLHWTFDAQAGSLTITGLTAMGILGSGWEVAKSYAMQHILYLQTRAAKVTDTGAGAGQ